MSKLSVAIRLFVITAVAAVCLALVNKVTAPTIASNSEKAFQESLSQVLPGTEGGFKPVDFGDAAADDETITIKSVYAGYSDKEQKNLVGYVATVVSSEGYSGDIEIMTGIDADFNITKVSILSSSETPGLGARAKEPEFIGQYEGKNSELTVVKGEATGDSEISAITSATITSNAVTKCVNASLSAVKTTAAKNAAAAVEIIETVEEKDKQSEAELDAVDENRRDEPSPVIVDEDEMEVDENEE